MSWYQLGTDLIGNGQNDGDEFGSAVDLSSDGTILAVSAIGENYINIFQYVEIDNSWNQLGTKIQVTNSNYKYTRPGALSLSADGTIIAAGGWADKGENIYVRDGILVVVKNGVVPDGTNIGN